VVAHAVPDIPSVYQGAGHAATQALYYFLRLRMRCQVIPTGLGIAPPHIAADEAWRSGARVAVMVRLVQIDYLPAPGGLGVRSRLEMAVVRDGRLVLRRYLESPPVGPAPPGMHRGRDYDPVFLSVSHALDSVSGELNGVLADIR
jgi:hypothetical protein